MNCLVTGGDLACFVTNYGLPDQNPANADDAENGNVATRGATVAMEYKASEPDATKRVQFYVFGGGDAAAGRINFADLDGLGPKPVPYLCNVCHGGTFDDGSNKSTQARFREFDLPSFKYSGNRSWDFGDATLSGTELTNFGTLNQMVRNIAPNPSPIRSLINPQPDQQLVPGQQLCHRTRGARRSDGLERAGDGLPSGLCQVVPHLPRRPRLRHRRQLLHIQRLHRLCRYLVRRLQLAQAHAERLRHLQELLERLAAGAALPGPDRRRLVPVSA
jgi:hypothetical protein